MSAVDITICTMAGTWHVDARLEQMDETELAAYELLLAMAAAHAPQETRKLSTAKPRAKAG